jgi:hypothetical protein
LEVVVQVSNHVGSLVVLAGTPEGFVDNPFEVAGKRVEPARNQGELVGNLVEFAGIPAVILDVVIEEFLRTLNRKYHKMMHSSHF